MAAAAAAPCSFLIETNTLMRHFRNVVSLASLAYIFSGIHAIQYSLLQLEAASDYNMDDSDTGNNNHNLQEPGNASSSHTSNPADTSSNSWKASGCWTDQETSLLLDYVEAHCPLNTSRGLNLKKTHFNKAREVVKSKDASQCYYKWGHVHMLHILDSDEGLSY